MKKRISVLSILLLLGMTVYAQTDTPQAVPSLQHWNGAKSKLTLPETGKIIITPGAKSLSRETAGIMAKDLKDMFGWNYQATSGKPKNHSIYLSVKKTPSSLGEESYELDIHNHVAIEASAVKGVLWGTRTLLQMIHNQPLRLMKGKALDYPQYAHRGLIIDVARKFFTMDYLQDYVKILSFYKMNELRIHLNDNGFVESFGNDWNKTYAAFRLEGERFPGLTSKDSSYTKEEFHNFQQVTARYRINIISKVDIPTHSLAFTYYNPILAANKKGYGMDHLDLYKKEVYDFLDALFDEYLSGDHPIFVGPDVHISTDEYNLKEAEQFRYFTEYYLKCITKYGKDPRLQGSLKHMKGNTPVNLKGKMVNTQSYSQLDLETALQEGTKTINACDMFLYIMPAMNYYHNFLDHQWIYKSWPPRMMQEGEVIEQSTNLLGAMFAVWNDRVGNGINQQDVHIRTFPAMQAMSEKLWRRENARNIPFETFGTRRRITPEAPGVNLQASIGDRKDLTLSSQGAALQGNDSILTSVPGIGYPYSVEFEIYTDPESNTDTVLFKGPYSVFTTNWQNTGRFAFSRDGYEFIFHSYRLSAEKWAKVRVEGDTKGTSLYTNGELQKRLEGQIGVVYNQRSLRKDSVWYQETLIFPLRQIGGKLLGFKGRIRNVTCAPLNEKRYSL